MASKHEKTYSGKYGDAEVLRGDGSLGSSKYTVEKPSGGYAFFDKQEPAHEFARSKAGKK